VVRLATLTTLAELVSPKTLVSLRKAVSLKTLGSLAGGHGPFGWKHWSFWLAKGGQLLGVSYKRP
jgi:hypothetical protein